MEFIKKTHLRFLEIFWEKVEIFPRHYLLTDSENDFFIRLQFLLKDQDCYICPKVRVWDIVWVKDINWHRDYKITWKVDRSHIDFTIISNKNSYIQCIIELDDKSHNTNQSHYRDEIKNCVFNEIGIPIHRFSNKFTSRQDLINRGIIKI